MKFGDIRPHRRRGRAARPALRRPAHDRRGLRPRGLLRISRRRAPLDAAGRRRLAGADHGGARLPHQEPALRPAGLSAAVLPSAAPDRRGLHARPDERRALPARRRTRRLDVRDRGLRPRLHQDPGDVPRGVPGAAQGLRLGRTEFAGRVLQVRQGADDPQAGAEAASAAVVRRDAAEQCGLARRERRQHRRARPARQHQRDHQGLPRDAREASARP